MEREELKALIEQGEGYKMQRMKTAMKEHGLEGPRFDIDKNWFTVLFDRPDLEERETPGETTQKTVNETVDKTVDKIINAIRNNPKITQKDLIAITGLTRRGIEWNINKLKKEGRIRRVGPRKGGNWEVIENEE